MKERLMETKLKEVEEEMEENIYQKKSKIKDK